MQKWSIGLITRKVKELESQTTKENPPLWKQKRPNMTYGVEILRSRARDQIDFLLHLPLHARSLTDNQGEVPMDL